MANIDLHYWREFGETAGWTAPKPAPLWLRLPVIRWFRTEYLAYQVEKHQEFHAANGSYITGYDGWVLHGMARGYI